MAKPKAKAKPKGPPDAARINARAAKDRQFLKRALKNPGLRSKLDPKYLPAPQRQARELNTRLNSPITPGSSVTGRDLAHEAEAATTVRYGPQERQLGQELGIARQTERDTGSFYDEYRRNLEQHAQNIAAFQAGAQQGLAQTAAGITGLAGQEGAAMQQQANQAAAQQGVAPAGNLMPEANAAAAVRQGLIGSFQAQQALTGAANNQYASAQSNVVAPGQKLSALMQAAGRTRGIRKDQEALAQQEGAFNQQFRSERRQDEFKNVLAQQTLGANVAENQAQAQTATARVTESNRAARARETTARRRLTSQEQQTKARLEAQARQGRLNRENQRKLAELRRREKAANDAAKEKEKEKGKGPDWRTPNETGAAMTQLTGLKGMANDAKSGNKFKPGPRDRPGAGTKLDRRGAAQKIIQFAGAKLKDPVLVTAALDAVYDGHLSPATVKKLIDAGYKPSRVASTLGVPTAGNYRPPRAPDRVRHGGGTA